MAFLEFRPTQTLFHYTSVDGFFSILKSKRLWFSDLASSNDPRELKFGLQHFVDALRSVRNNEYRGERGQFLSILEEHLTSYHKNAQAFCCCFSFVADQLPMWGAYGAAYRGIALGFRPTSIFDIPARVQKVAYADEDAADDFRKFVLYIASQFDDTRNPDDLSYWIPATSSAFAAITALKHITWAYEREVRVVHAQRKQPPDRDDLLFTITGVLPSGQPVKWAKPLERASGARVVSYLEFPFGRYRDGVFDPAEAIERVVVGPNCPLSEADVTAVMQEHGFKNFEVARSVCQIR